MRKCCPHPRAAYAYPAHKNFFRVPFLPDPVTLILSMGPINGHPPRKPTRHQSLSGLPAHIPAPRGGPCVPAATSVSHHPLECTVRLVGWPDSGGCPTGCWGDSTPLGSLGNTLLAWTDSLVAQTRWDNPPGHMADVLPGVRFATREPAAVIQTVVHCVLQNRFAGSRIRRVAGKHIG